MDPVTLAAGYAGGFATVFTFNVAWTCVSERRFPDWDDIQDAASDTIKTFAKKELSAVGTNLAVLGISALCPPAAPAAVKAQAVYDQLDRLRRNALRA